jgi:PAS domain S-box-containing protein
MTTDQRILIVDDDVDFAESLKDELESRGYRMAVAHNAREALDWEAALRPQVVLMDIRLQTGAGDGLDLLDQLKRKNPALLGIVMTAYANLETAIKAVQGEVFAFLRKPINQAALSAALARCFEKVDREQQTHETIAALRVSEERYRSIFENALVGIFRFAPSRGFIDANPALVQMLGYDTREEVLALDLRKDLYSDPQDLLALVDQHLAAKTVRRLQATWKKKNGDRITVSISSRLVLDSEGRATYYEGLVQEIPDRKAAGQ